MSQQSIHVGAGRKPSPPIAGAGRGAVAGTVAVAVSGYATSQGIPPEASLALGALSAGFLAGIGKQARETGGWVANIFGFLN